MLSDVVTYNKAESCEIEKTPWPKKLKNSFAELWIKFYQHCVTGLPGYCNYSHHRSNHDVSYTLPFIHSTVAWVIHISSVVWFIKKGNLSDCTPVLRVFGDYKNRMPCEHYVTDTAKHIFKRKSLLGILPYKSGEDSQSTKTYIRVTFQDWGSVEKQSM